MDVETLRKNMGTSQIHNDQNHFFKLSKMWYFACLFAELHFSSPSIPVQQITVVA